jgi:hypothetical protein
VLALLRPVAVFQMLRFELWGAGNPTPSVNIFAYPTYLVVVSVLNLSGTGIGMAAFFTLASRAFGRTILFEHALSGEGFSYMPCC